MNNNDSFNWAYEAQSMALINNIKLSRPKEAEAIINRAKLKSETFHISFLDALRIEEIEINKVDKIDLTEIIETIESLNK
jgi:hypothetical protein